jgi:hypothetical protein
LIGFEFLAALTMKSYSVIWDTTPCSPVKVSRRFRETYRSNLQGRRISQARSQHQAGSKLLAASFMLGLIFDAVDGSDMFLRNIVKLSPEYKALYPRR